MHNFHVHGLPTVRLMDENVCTMNGVGQIHEVTGTELRDQMFHDSGMSQLIGDGKLLLLSFSGNDANDTCLLTSLHKAHKPEDVICQAVTNVRGSLDLPSSPVPTMYQHHLAILLLLVASRSKQDTCGAVRASPARSALCCAHLQALHPRGYKCLPIVFLTDTPVQMRNRHESAMAIGRIGWRVVSSRWILDSRRIRLFPHLRVPSALSNSLTSLKFDPMA